jgi:hypothetical protein
MAEKVSSIFGGGQMKALRAAQAEQAKTLEAERVKVDAEESALRALFGGRRGRLGGDAGGLNTLLGG